MSAYALLLLPPAPSNSLKHVRAAYEPAISAAFAKLSQCDGSSSGGDSKSSSITAHLDTAVEVPGLLSFRPRSSMFAHLQHLLGNIYNVFCAVSAARCIELDIPGGIDVRVIFVDCGGNYNSNSMPPEQGPIIGIRTLAMSRRPWDFMFVVQSVGGEKLAQAFAFHWKNRRLDIYSVPGSAGGDQEESMMQLTGSSLIAKDASSSNYNYNYSVVVGGTFDHLHIGHKLLLTATALALDPAPPTQQQQQQQQQRLMTIGVTGDELLVNKKYAEALEDWDQRCHSTASFLTDIMDFSSSSSPVVERVNEPGPNGKYVLVKLRPNLTLKLVQISDAFGPTITDKNITAIVVSAETRSGGKAVNEEREKKGWEALDVLEIDVLLSGETVAAAADAGREEDFASKISSTEIRRHRMDLAKGSSSL